MPINLVEFITFLGSEKMKRKMGWVYNQFHLSPLPFEEINAHYLHTIYASRQDTSSKTYRIACIHSINVHNLTLLEKAENQFLYPTVELVGVFASTRLSLFSHLQKKVIFRQTYHC